MKTPETLTLVNYKTQETVTLVNDVIELELLPLQIVQ